MRGEGTEFKVEAETTTPISGGTKKTVTFDEKFVRSEKSPSSALVGGKRRRGYHRSYGEDDSDKENNHRGNRGQHHHHQYHHQHHHHGNHRDLWDSPSPGGSGAGGGGRVKMKSPRVSFGASSWAAGEQPKFVVPRMKSHVSPSAVKMKMRSEDLTSSLWAELVFSSDDEFDKVTSLNDNKWSLSPKHSKGSFVLEPKPKRK